MTAIAGHAGLGPGRLAPTMATFGPPSDDESNQTGDQMGGQKTFAAEPGAFDDDESTEVVNSAEIGGFFGGRFRIDARLGVGAMGRVLTALDTETGQLVALKVLHRERSRDKNVLRRFAREAASLRAINHPAIVGIVASGRAPDGTPWLAMEHLTGQTLKARIAKTKMQPAEFWPILKTLAEAIGEAHARGVVHRDLKPENIFVPEGNVPPCKILDFGLSTLNREGADKVTATGQLLGTPRYMAPELLASIGKPDHRVDVFALAVITFEALTGRSLYSADDLGSLFGQILEARTHSLRQFRPDLSEGLEAVIRQGHARSMSDRFPTAAAYATAFAQAAGIAESLPMPQAPALSSLFDDVGDSDGNAPLIDPFGAPARATGQTPAMPLPPLAADVPPFLPVVPVGPPATSAHGSRPGRTATGTQYGVAPAGLPLPGPALPGPAFPGMARPLPSQSPMGFGAPAPERMGASVGGPGMDPRIPTPAQPSLRPPMATVMTPEMPLSPQPAPPPSFGAAAQAGSARGFTAPSDPRFTAPPNAPPTAAPTFAAAPSAAPSAAPGLFADRRVLGCLLFAVAALVVVTIAVVGAVGLRWYVARGGF